MVTAADLKDAVVRGTEEVVTVEDLEKSLSASEFHLKAYAGYEPSGSVHLGHLLTLRKLKDLQDAGFKVIVLLADLHAYLNCLLYTSDAADE